MSNGSRLVVVLAAVAALVVGFAVLRPGDDEPAGTPVATAPSDPLPTATDGPSAPSEPAPTETTPAAPEPAPEPQIPTIMLEGGKPDGGPLKLQATAGEDIVFRVASDVADEIHVHGYDTFVETRPGRTATVRIEDAKLEGVFEVELESSHTKIAELTVSPS